MTTKPLTHTAHHSGVPALECSVEARVVTITGAASVLFVPKEKCTRKILRSALDTPQWRASSHCT